jgi:hypothetical protein
VTGRSKKAQQSKHPCLDRLSRPGSDWNSASSSSLHVVSSPALALPAAASQASLPKMALKQNGGAHLVADIDFIETPEPPAETIVTGKDCGVRLTKVRSHSLAAPHIVYMSSTTTRLHIYSIHSSPTPADPSRSLPPSRTPRCPPTVPDMNNGPTSSSSAPSWASRPGCRGRLEAA